MIVARKQWYGVTHDGYMTPCHAKDPSKCYWHVPNKHTVMDENQADEYNEDWAKRQYMAHQGYSTSIRDNEVLRKETSGQKKFMNALTLEERRIRERYNDMARCGELGEGIAPVTFIDFNVRSVGMDSPVLSDKYEYIVYIGMCYDPANVPRPVGMSDDDEYEPTQEQLFWNRQIKAMRSFLTREMHRTDAGENQSRSIGDVMANTSYRFDYYKMVNLNQPTLYANRGLPNQYRILGEDVDYYPDNIEPGDDVNGPVPEPKKLYNVQFFTYLVPDDELNKVDTDEENQIINDTHQIRQPRGDLA